MKKEQKLLRDVIVQALGGALKPLDYVHAFWEGGAAASKRIDEWSDIDLYLVVDDDKVDEAFRAVENVLKGLSPIKQEYRVGQTPWQGVSQAFYKLENASPYLLIDIAVLKLSSPEKFLEPHVHGEAVFYFNKSDKIAYPTFDREAFAGRLRERLVKLQTRFSMFNSFVQKELNRGNFLEAIDMYNALTLASLVEALRIRHNPLHYDFRMRYVHYELPSEVVERLTRLYLVRGVEDLQAKYDQATEWFNEVMSEIDAEHVEKLLKT